MVIGEAADEEITRAVHDIAQEDETAVRVDNPHTMHFGPDDVLLTMGVRFERDRSAGEVLDGLDRIEKAIRERFPVIKHVYIVPEPADQRGDDRDARDS